MSTSRINQLQYGSKTIEFELEYADRKTLGIYVRPDSSVLVKAPEGVGLEKVEEKVRKRASWILKQKSYFLSFQPRTPERLYISGETHLYLGKQYRLKVLEGEELSVKLSGGYFYLTVGSKEDTESIEKLLESWYRKHAQVKFEAYLAECYPLFKRYLSTYPPLQLRKMTLRWGSCTPKGKIILNPELIKAPRRCVEYVILHELCHLVVPNHNGKFFELQERMMPDWKRWKERLEQVLA